MAALELVQVWFSFGSLKFLGGSASLDSPCGLSAAATRARQRGANEGGEPGKIPQMRLADGCLMHLRLQIKLLSWVVQLTT